MKPSATHWIGSALLTTGFLCAPWPSFAKDTPSQLCDRASLIAAKRTGVPVEILHAISRVESGRTVKGLQEPWPWVVNIAGEGHWLTSSDATIGLISAAMHQGETSIDVGCFQINLLWHGQAFSSLEDMVDPFRNADYAADFLTELYDKTGSWRAAIGAYHSRHQAKAEPYIGRVRAHLLATSDTAPADAIPTRVNRFPLFRAGTPGSLGSVFSHDSGGPTSPLLR